MLTGNSTRSTRIKKWLAFVLAAAMAVSLTPGGAAKPLTNVTVPTFPVLEIDSGNITIQNGAIKNDVVYMGDGIDGVEINIAAFNIDGYNYFRLRDLAILLDFAVSYSDNNVSLDLTNGYTE